MDLTAHWQNIAKTLKGHELQYRSADKKDIEIHTSALNFAHIFWINCQQQAHVVLDKLQ